ncbi:ornithine cyclodeaminase family protein [Isoptericola sp. S6320L]|uniref:ornithine cyclodeaminase family protein n=1 Tax=Isoptericola sp. S6320L TaxID=2926411 RepID=UPI001FF0E692|nr:ornithine cyclodeaminase family protein [Isoptericola sp. S6320L]MCK0117220.1 ornithine cyclodeaminase family protein [Isoptericola sp. S6320L]
MPLVLTRSDLIGLVQPAEVVDAVERAFADLSDGTAAQAPLAVAALDDAAHFLPMTAVSRRAGLAGSKLLADVPGNRDRGLPAQRSVLVLVDVDDGGPVAVLDGGLPTRLRTAAASAVATRWLAPPSARVLGLVGAGGLALEHVSALATVRPLEQVLFWTRSDATAATFAERTAARHPEIKVTRVGSPESAVGSADVVCTLTPSREPVVRGEWFHPGMHVNVVGAPPRPDHREVDGAAMARSRVVVDSVSTALGESGDVLLAIAEGAIDAAACRTELGDVVTGRASGRRAAAEITVFNSVGLGLLDVAVGRLLLDAARAAGRGLTVDLSA